MLSRTEPAGEDFKILGVSFDCKLIMKAALENLRTESSWRLQTILRVRRFHTTSEMFNLYKSKVLSFVEYRTPAVYHACATHLDAVDAVQRRFLRALNVSETEALLEHNMVPLCTRRDIALLGLIHRTVIGKRPSHFSDSSV